MIPRLIRSSTLSLGQERRRRAVKRREDKEEMETQNGLSEQPGDLDRHELEHYPAEDSPHRGQQACQGQEYGDVSRPEGGGSDLHQEIDAESPAAQICKLESRLMPVATNLRGGS
jgi:hypothetical protein